MSDQTKELKAQNKRAEDKIVRNIKIIELLDIRREHFGKLSDLKFIPMFLRAKYRLKAYELEAEILAKKDFNKIYAERIANVKYAEKVIEPDQNGAKIVEKMTVLKDEK